MIFTSHTACGSLRRQSSAPLDSGHDLFISRRGQANMVELALYSHHGSCSMRFSPEQARAIAAELLACAQDDLTNGEATA